MRARSHLADRFVRAERAAAEALFSPTDARAAVATLLWAEAFGWPTARKPLSDLEWDRVTRILHEAGEHVPGDWRDAGPDPRRLDASALKDYAAASRTVLDLVGRAFVVVEYISPRLRIGVEGTVQTVQYVDEQWRLGLSIDRQPRPLEYLSLAMFGTCTMPPELLTPEDRRELEQQAGNNAPEVVPVVHSPEPGPARLWPRQRAGNGVAVGCGPTGATSTAPPTLDPVAPDGAS